MTHLRSEKFWYCKAEPCLPNGHALALQHHLMIRLASSLSSSLYGASPASTFEVGKSFNGIALQYDSEQGLPDGHALTMQHHLIHALGLVALF